MRVRIGWLGSVVRSLGTPCWSGSEYFAAVSRFRNSARSRNGSHGDVVETDTRIQTRTYIAIEGPQQRFWDFKCCFCSSTSSKPLLQRGRRTGTKFDSCSGYLRFISGISFRFFITHFGFIILYTK